MKKSEVLNYTVGLLGVATDHDGWFGAQCVDLIMHLISKFWNFEAGGNAIDYKWNELPSGFKRWQGNDDIQSGDILVWDFDDQYGHVGYCISKDGDYVTSVEQNVDGTTDIGGPARRCTRNICDVTAVIRPPYDEEVEVEEITESLRTVEEVAMEVLNGEWGNGDERYQRLTAMGYSYYDVQKMVNSLLNKEPVTAQKKTVDELAKEVLRGVWGNGTHREKALTNAGYDYDAVQERVNELLEPAPVETILAVAKEVIRGEWGNGSERVNRLIKAGYDYDAVQDEVNRLLA